MDGAAAGECCVPYTRIRHVGTRLHRSHPGRRSRIAHAAGAVDHQVNRRPTPRRFRRRATLDTLAATCRKAPSSRVRGRHDTKRERRIAWKGCAALS
jgi:hypothetical protein